MLHLKIVKTGRMRWFEVQKLDGEVLYRVEDSLMNAIAFAQGYLSFLHPPIHHQKILLDFSMEGGYAINTSDEMLSECFREGREKAEEESKK